MHIKKTEKSDSSVPEGEGYSVHVVQPWGSTPRPFTYQVFEISKNAQNGYSK